MDIKKLKKKSTLAAESKDLLLKLEILKKQMQKTLVFKEPPTLSTKSSTCYLFEDKKSNTSIQELVVPLTKDKSIYEISQISLDNVRTKSEQVITPRIDLQSTHFNKISKIRENIIGFNTRYMSPFNIELESVYVDHTATNRPYRTVEDMVQYAKRFIANPHTQFSHFGKFSTEMMHYAHQSLLNTFSADKFQFVALPTGSGSTGAIQKAIKMLKCTEDKNIKPTVYITPYEHHSNILPWIEFYDNINVLASDQDGNLLINKIEQQLLNNPSDNIIVSVSAASNVTSTLTDLKGLNEVIKSIKAKKNTVFAADCAAYCCHHELNLKQLDQIDFVYLSPHKNLGGAQGCGVLIARKKIVKNIKPTFPGGGTVSFVKGYKKTDLMYDDDVFNRQIAGTPPFLGFYRAALSFELLKNEIGYDFIHGRQVTNTQKFIQIIDAANLRLKQKDEGSRIVIYGGQDFSKRANIITFNILSKGQIMQHNLVSLILADVFGVQLRSGCFCAGPFGMQLLKLDESIVSSIQEEVSVGIMKRKPGYLRLDLSFYLQLYEIEFIAKAIVGVAQYSNIIGKVYTLCNDGEIIRHSFFKKCDNSNYGLGNASFVKQFLQKDEETNLQRLKKRKDTLYRQYKRGMNIVMKPIQFLRSQINPQTY